MSWPKLSTGAFWLAFAVLLVGLFVALGGPAYAAELPSAAHDQYVQSEEAGDPGENTPVFLPPQREDDSGSTGAVLPNTGLSLLATAVIGLGLVSLGFAMRRREQRKS